MDSQIIIAGGGPVGNYLASKLTGCSTTIFEEHATIGKPVQCTGLVNPRVIDMVHGEETVLNEIKGLRLCFPDNRTIEIKTDETKATVIDRQRFDKLCSTQAEKAGAEIKTSAKVTGFKKGADGLEVSCSINGEKSVYHTNLLIGADGYKSQIGNYAGLDCAKEIIRGIQADVKFQMEDQSLVEVYVGKDVAPGFFAWVLPCGEFTRIGLGISQGNGVPSKYLEKLLVKKGLEEAERTQTYSGVIPIGCPKKTYADNVLIVGDAAAQTKPISGGGLFSGFTCANYAAETALAAINENDFSAEFLSSYDDKWRGDIGKELDRGLLVRKMYTGMSDKKLCEAGKLLDKKEAKDVIATGDIDYPSQLAVPLLKAVPGIMKLAPGAIRSLIMGK